MFEYDFKLEIAKKVKICLLTLLISNYYVFKSYVLEMEELDAYGCFLNHKGIL